MNFQAEVINKSKELPVLVDFWAPWCGPCRVLGPVLESLAREHSGQWELVKINTEDHQDLAAQFNIYSIPAVKLFHNGEVVGEFVGALSKRQIEQWLKEHLPDESHDSLTLILALEGDFPDYPVYEQVERWARQNPYDEDAALFMAKYKLLDQPQEAAALVKPISFGHPQHALAESLRTIAAFLAEDYDESIPTGYKLKAVQEALKRKDLEAAIKSVIDAASLDKSFADELPRRLGVALFLWIGVKHPLSLKHRRLFDMMMY